MEEREEKERTLISQTGISSKGFTLLELVVVIFILSLTLMMVYPSININKSIMSEVKRFASILRYLNDTSITTKNSLKLKIFLQEKRILYETQEGLKEERFPHLDYIETPSRGIIRDSEVELTLKPSGLREELRFSFLEKDERFFVILNPFSNRVVVKKDEKE